MSGTLNISPGKLATRTVEYERCEKCGAKLAVVDGVVSPCGCDELKKVRVVER